MAFSVSRSLARSLPLLASLGCSFDATGLGQNGTAGQSGTAGSSTGAGTSGGPLTGVTDPTSGGADPSGDPGPGDDSGSSTGPATTLPVDPTTTTGVDPSTSSSTTVVDPSTTTTGGEHGSSSSGGSSSSSGACVEKSFYKDGDKDGYGDPGQLEMACEQPEGYVPDDTDCDDKDPMSHSGGTEFCDKHDNDCDTKFDEYTPDTNTDCDGCKMFAFNGLLYHFCGGTESWDNAKAKCEGRGAALAKDLDQAQHDWLLARLTEINAAAGSWWLGGRTEGDNGAFKWLDGTAVGGFTPWAVGYPTIIPDTNCLRLASPATPVVANQWLDANCGEKRPLICAGPVP